MVKLLINSKHVARILYKNWQGEISWRKIVPITIVFESNQWHQEEQWILKAFDIEKQNHRSFALANIIEWIAEKDAQEILDNYASLKRDVIALFDMPCVCPHCKKRYKANLNGGIDHAIRANGDYEITCENCFHRLYPKMAINNP